MEVIARGRDRGPSGGRGPGSFPPVVAPGVADHHRPQADRDPVPDQQLRVLLHRGGVRADHAARTRPARSEAHQHPPVQRDLHAPWDADDLPVHLPGAERVRELLRAAPDRGAGHGVPPDQRTVVLAAPGGRADDPVGVRHQGWGGGVRLDELRPGVPSGRDRRGSLDAGTAHRGRVIAARCHQLHRHDPSDARPRDDHAPHPDLRLGGAGHLAAGRPGHPGLHLRVVDAVRRPPPRHRVLQPGPRRQRAAVAERVLVLRASRGLHADPGRVGDRERDPARVLGQAAVRLPRGGAGLPAHHGPVLHGVGPPHVRHRSGRAALLLGDHRDDLHPDRCPVLQLAGHDLQREGCGSNRPCCSRWASSPCS